MSRTKNGTIKELPASNNGYRYVVEVEGEEWPWYLTGLGAPKEAKVGEKGILTFSSTTRIGYWSWTKI